MRTRLDLSTHKIVKNNIHSTFCKIICLQLYDTLIYLAKSDLLFIHYITACKQCVYFKFARWPRYSAYTKHTLDKSLQGEPKIALNRNSIRICDSPCGPWLRTQPGNECTLDILNVALYFHLNDKSSSSFSHCLSIYLYIDVINVDVRGVLVYLKKGLGGTESQFFIGPYDLSKLSPMKKQLYKVFFLFRINFLLCFLIYLKASPISL